jgi:hypothetical protein
MVIAATGVLWQLNLQFNNRFQRATEFYVERGQQQAGFCSDVEPQQLG